MGQEATPETYEYSEALGASDSHALLLPFPAQGHITPFLQLAKRLASDGVWVTVALMQSTHARVVRAQRSGALFTSDDYSKHRLRFVPIRDGLPPEFDNSKAGSEKRNHVIDKELPDAVLELIGELGSQGRPVTCIIGDFFLQWTCTIAHKVAVPEFVFWPQCASTFSMNLSLDAITCSGYDPFDANVALNEEFIQPITCIPGLPSPVLSTNLPFDLSVFGATVLPWMRDLLKERLTCLREAQGVIVNSFEALEPEVFEALQKESKQETPYTRFESLRLVGPLSPVSDRERDDDSISVTGSMWAEDVQECMQWLDKQAPGSVLFVAFGSIRFMSVAQAQEVALGLAASGCKFLWVVRENFIKATEAGQEPSLANSSVALEEALPAGFLEENEHVCKVVQWAPQARVLSHVAVGGFFSHCGWNSTLDGLCAGVPLLGWPWLADQFSNCWLVAEVWKVGVALERGPKNQACRRQVEQGVRQLMGGPLSASLRARARDISASAAHDSQGMRSFTREVLNLRCGIIAQKSREREAADF